MTINLENMREKTSRRFCVRIANSRKKRNKRAITIGDLNASIQTVRIEFYAIGFL